MIFLNDKCKDFWRIKDFYPWKYRILNKKDFQMEVQNGTSNWKPFLVHFQGFRFPSILNHPELNLEIDWQTNFSVRVSLFPRWITASKGLSLNRTAVSIFEVLESSVLDDPDFMKMLQVTLWFFLPYFGQKYCEMTQPKF